MPIEAPAERNRLGKTQRSSFDITLLPNLKAMDSVERETAAQERVVAARTR